ncbi:HAD hydrolase-like protein [Streptomyces sp. NPDC087844]|uniref:HAD hydrolase-like protein n=1 Tax=Streptomyces sp. NPDC087844 TaxID=3365805 RepID=UPI0037F848D1
MIRTAAERLRTLPERTLPERTPPERTPPEGIAVIGDVGADVEAARRAGAFGVLGPGERTRPEEVTAAGRVAPDRLSAVRAPLTGPPPLRVRADGPTARNTMGKVR